MKNLLITLGVIAAIISLIFYEQMAQIIFFVGYTSAGLLLMSGLFIIFFGAWNFTERVKLTRAQRIEAEKNAHVLTVTENGQTWVRDTDGKAAWRNLTGTPTLYINGHRNEPSEMELDLYRYRLAMVHKAPKVINGAAQKLSAGDATTPLDLLMVFTQPTQSYAIIGGQQTGKTFQARHIAAHWLRQGVKPLVVGPKWDKGEWGGCYLIGGNGDFAVVEWGITMVRRLVEQRHGDNRIGHRKHPIQPVFFDDWTPIVDAVSSARTMVLEATTLYASVNILLYFMLHSDTAHAWGVDRKGAALKENFVKLFIVPQYDENGMVIRSQTKGVIRFAGESIDRPASLFSGPPVDKGKPLVIAPPTQAAVAPSPKEIAMIELAAAGHSYNEISRRVFGHTGGKQVKAIKQAIERYS